jgi:hypothetical protein
MLTSRREHSAVYHALHLYAIGGWNASNLKECERYICSESRWETLPALPRASGGVSGVVVKDSLYALGGRDGAPLDSIQKLNLELLTWELMQLKLPVADCGIPCFKADGQVYLVIEKTLYSFVPQLLQVLQVKSLPGGMKSWCGPSYYSRGMLYCTRGVGAVDSWQIGSLG